MDEKEEIKTIWRSGLGGFWKIGIYLSSGEADVYGLGLLDGGSITNR